MVFALALCASATWVRAQDVLSPSGPVRQPIVVGLPLPAAGPGGELVVQPNVNATGQLPPGAVPYANLPGIGPPGHDPPHAVKPADNAQDGGSIFTRQSGGVVTASAMMPPGAPQLAPPLAPPYAPASQLAPYQMPAGQTATAQTPNMQTLLARQPAPMPPGPPTAAASGPSSEELPPGAAMPGAPGIVDPTGSDPVAQPIFAQAVNQGCGCGCGAGCGDGDGHHKGTWYGLSDKPCGCDGGGGLGHERVMFALFDMDSSQPESDLRFQFNAIYHEKDPDRAEYFWGEIGVLGPKLPEPYVNWQSVDTSLQLASGKAFSLTTEIPLVLVDPVNNPNTAGLGDLSITTKTVLLNGSDWQITQFFRTYINTGDSMKGLGTGHVSLEPGFLFQYKWSPETYFHGEVKYWFPIGGDPAFGGQVLRYGFGVSHLLYENDTFAAMPTLEFVGYTVFDGMQSSPTGIPQMIDTMGIINVEPGIRFASDTGGDLGVIDWGVHASFAATPNRWYNAALLLEIRFLFQ